MVKYKFYQHLCIPIRMNNGLLLSNDINNNMDIRTSIRYCKENSTCISTGIFHNLNNDTDIKVVSFSSLRKYYNREIQAEHAHDFYIISFFKKGQCLYYRDFEKILIGPKTVALMPPGQYHHYDEGEIEGYGVCFSHNAFIGLDIEVVNLIKFYLFSNNKGIIRIEDEHIYHEFEDIVKIILCEYKRKEHPLTLNIKMKSLLHYYLIKLFDYYSQHHEIDIQRTSCLFLRFSAKVERNFKKWHKVAQYAEDLHVGYKELSKIVRAETNKRPIEIIIDRIILEAKKLLVFTDKSIKEISVELGFEKQSNFSSLFKKEIGVCPNVYRSNYSKERDFQLTYRNL